jgi:dienelactone hydrolase
MRRLLHLSFVLVCCSTFALTARAQASVPVPVQTFKASYKALNPYVEWETWLTQAQKCTETQVIYGAEPTAPGKYPLLVYLHSTIADWGGNFEGQRFVQLAAAQGYVAVAFTYDSFLTVSATAVDHAYCMFTQSQPGNAVTAVCAVAEADCSRGILVAGFSQGGAIAAYAKNYNSNVDAVWALGINGPTSPQLVAAPTGSRALPNNKLRIDLGQSDVTQQNTAPADFSSLEAMTGHGCGTAWNCLQPDGSGYYVVQNSEVGDGNADHCYWMQVNKVSPGYSCTLFPAQLDPGFQPPATTPWSMISNLNWLKQQLR